MTTLDAALALAAQGIRVFPCLQSKAPACAGGFKAASKDPDTIRAMFANPAAVLIGVPTGAASGLDALDLDPRHGSDAWWSANQHRIPATLIHQTRSGGKHLIFRHQPGLTCSVGALAAGCDVRSTGGFIVWWAAAGLEPWLAEDPLPWPAWLLEGLNARREPNPEPRDLARLAPPSAAAVVDVLRSLPNPASAGRDTYAQVMLAAAGCIQALGDDPDGAIADAAVAWAERWEGGSEQDERQKWESDWSTREEPKAGWNTLLKVARQLIPGFTDPTAGLEFDALPPQAPVPDRRRIIAPGECDGIGTRPYVVKGLLAERDVACLFGPPGAGKSLVGPLLAYCIARGEPFFALRTRQGGALYVAAEDESGMERRVSALRLAHGDAPGFGLVKGVSDLLNPSSGDLAWLQAVVAERKPALVIIDTLAMAFPGLIENDADGMGRVVAVARKLTEHGAAVLVVHHDTKARDGTPRGHSLLNGALDVAIALEPKDADGIVRGRLTKNRNGSCEHELAFRIGVRVLGTDQDGDPITAAVAVELGEEEAAAKAAKLSPTEASALTALRECVADNEGQPVAEDVWIDRCEGLSGAATQESRARAARRMRAGLVQKGQICFVRGTVIMAEPNQLGHQEWRHRTGSGQPQGIEFVERTFADNCADKTELSAADSGQSGQHPIGAVRLSARPSSTLEGVV